MCVFAYERLSVRYALEVSINGKADSVVKSASDNTLNPNDLSLTVHPAPLSPSFLPSTESRHGVLSKRIGRSQSHFPLLSP